MRTYYAVLFIRLYCAQQRISHQEVFRTQASNLETARDDILRQARQRHPQGEFIVKALTCERVRR